MTTSDPTTFDDPVGASLATTHAHLARRAGHAVTYQSDVATFASVGTDPDPASWDDLARLLGPGQVADLFDSPATPPADWTPVFALNGVRMVATSLNTDTAHAETADIVELGADDVPDMLDLVHRTEPGPFRPRTHELGTYLGIRVGGELVAMAGQRLQPPGWTEISAVCTAPEARGHGHATRLITALAARIIASGRRPFLHAVAANTTAIALYERLGFAVESTVKFRGFRIPAHVRTSARGDIQF